MRLDLTLKILSIFILIYIAYSYLSNYINFEEWLPPVLTNQCWFDSITKYSSHVYAEVYLNFKLNVLALGAEINLENMLIR